jgi:hypothetical protein
MGWAAEKMSIHILLASQFVKAQRQWPMKPLWGHWRTLYPNPIPALPQIHFFSATLFENIPYPPTNEGFHASSRRTADLNRRRSNATSRIQILVSNAEIA